MAITPGTVNHAALNTGSTVTTISAVTNPYSSASRYLLVKLCFNGAGSGISSITYGGVALSPLTAVTPESGVGNAIRALKLPATGSNDLVITLTANPTYGGHVSYQFLDGVDQTTTVRSTATDATYGSSTSLALSTQPDDYASMVASDYNDATLTPSGAMVNDFTPVVTGTTGFACGHAVATGTTTTLGWSAGSYLVSCAVALIPAAASDETGTADFQASTPTLDATGEQPHSGVASLVVQDGQIVAVGVMQPSGVADFSLAAPTFDATGAQSFLGTLDAQVSTPTFDAVGGQEFLGTFDASLAPPTLDATGAMQPEGTADLQASTPTLDAVGEQPHTGTADLTATVPTLDATGVTGAETGTASFDLGAATLEAMGVMPPAGTADLIVVTPTLDATGGSTGAGTQPHQLYQRPLLVTPLRLMNALGPFIAVLGALLCR